MNQPRKKGVICAGGKGTRLLPITKCINKHMVPLVNKPMILWPLDTLKKLGCTDIMIVTGGNDVGDFSEFLGDGHEYGVRITYAVQSEAGGIAQAIACAEDFAYGGDVTVILGDNIFLPYASNPIPQKQEGFFTQIYLKRVADPRRFGCPEMDESGEIISLEEKPSIPKSDFAITGLYIFPFDVFDVIRGLVPSLRGELEVTDILNHYLSTGDLKYEIISGFWKDAGTVESLKEVLDMVINTPLTNVKEYGIIKE